MVQVVVHLGLHFHQGLRELHHKCISIVCLDVTQSRLLSQVLGWHVLTRQAAR